MLDTLRAFHARVTFWAWPTIPYTSFFMQKILRNNLALLCTLATSVIFAVLLSGCSFVERNTIGLFSSESETAELPPASTVVMRDQTTQKPEAKNPSKVPVEGKIEKPIDRDIIEVLWKIPEERPDGFVLRYGFERNALSFTVELQESEVEKFDHPKFGYVYRYEIDNYPPNKSVFVALQTKIGTKLSDPSDIFEVAPNKSAS